MAHATTMEMDFHKGETLLKLAATYPQLHEVVEEAVQNALDSLATKITIKINWKQRFIAVRDNGCGVSKEKFAEALKSVGKSVKDVKKLGRFGLGLISPLGKCDYFTFTSCAAPDANSYVEWTVNTAAIKAQTTELHIPMRERKEIRFNESSTWWRTQVEIHNFTNDKIISALDIDELKTGILAKYSHTMLRNHTLVHITFVNDIGEEVERKFRGNAFSGEALPELTLESHDSGKVLFRLFVTTKRHRDRTNSVNVRLGEIGNDFRFSFANFSRSVAVGKIGPTPETMEALRSGIFEGEILGERVKLTPQRTAFVRDDAFLDFCVLIDEWYKQQGKPHYNKAKSERREQRYQNLGVKSLQSLEKMLNDPTNANLLDVVRTMFPIGSIGPGHANPINRVIGSEQPTPSLASRGGAGKKRTKTTNNGDDTHIRVGKRENQAHTPMSVQGPRGQHRRTVRSNSIGLQFAYDTVSGSSDLWQLDREEGVLVFNITHPLWVMCDKSDSLVCSLQENIVLQVLTLEVMPEMDFYQHRKLFATEYTKLFVSWLADHGLHRRRTKAECQDDDEPDNETESEDE